MAHKILASLAVILATVPLMAQETDKGRATVNKPSNAEEAIPQAMLEMQYADAQGCFIINGNEVRPVLPLLVASDGLGNIKRENIIAALDAALERGCDINQPDINGVAPLHAAILQGNIELVRYLLQHGADSEQIITNGDSDSGKSLDSVRLAETIIERDSSQAEIMQKILKLLKNE